MTKAKDATKPAHTRIILKLLDDDKSIRFRMLGSEKGQKVEDLLEFDTPEEAQAFMKEMIRKVAAKA